MIPEALKSRFDMRAMGAVRRDDFVMAYGRPSRVKKITFRPDLRQVEIEAHDIFNEDSQSVMMPAGAHIMTFRPERRSMLALFVDGDSILTDTEEEVHSRDPVRAGDRVHVWSAPVAFAGLWAVATGVEKIEPGVGLDPEAAMQLLVAE